jgi:hypothetical protein
MAADIPTREPDSITAGDTIQWSKSLPDYPPGDGWSLAYALRHPTAPAINVNAATDGDGYLVTIPASTSANYTAGQWNLFGYVSNGSNREQIFRGYLTILADPVAAATLDTRSHARKVLALVEAALEGRASATLLETEIEGVKLKRIPHADLMALRDKYRAEVASEDNALAVSQGLGSRRDIRIRFGGVK